MLAHAQRMISLFAPDKEFAFCRVGRRAYGAGRARRREAAGDGDASGGVHGVADCTGMARAERTKNMWGMDVTLDVSKVSGWLNALASCRVEKRACDAEQGAGRETGGRAVAAAQVARFRVGQPKAGGHRARAERTPNM